MDLYIRRVNDKDYNYVEAMIRASFWNVYKPGCDEHVMAHKIRESEEYIPELDFVAETDGQILGCVMGTKARILNDNCEDTQSVVAVGPIGVLPKWQGKGIGSFLMEQIIERAAEYGYKGLVLYGNPAFYSRFGFVNAKEYSITMPDGNNIEEFMVLELGENSLCGIHGKCFESNAFEVSKEELLLFEKKFLGKCIDSEKLPQLDYERIQKEFLEQEINLSLTKEDCTGLTDTEKMEINPCGTYCGECEDYGVVCDGCRNRKGKPIWYDLYSKKETCSYYTCTNDSKYHDCSQCDYVPCNKFFDYPDPNMPEELKQMWFKLRMENFNQLNCLKEIKVKDSYQENVQKYMK